MGGNNSKQESGPPPELFNLRMCFHNLNAEAPDGSDMKLARISVRKDTHKEDFTLLRPVSDGTDPHIVHFKTFTDPNETGTQRRVWNLAAGWAEGTNYCDFSVEKRVMTDILFDNGWQDKGEHDGSFFVITLELHDGHFQYISSFPFNPFARRWFKQFPTRGEVPEHRNVNSIELAMRGVVLNLETIWTAGVEHGHIPLLLNANSG
eukprot:TRINITY_DN59421_c0_g1_i1.p2 TRINITY_DN59421_c0_g1~~TRINITY_DN59421_c0_g1_i1.p2  ORF type:complete len:206 (-),score=3.03 TRINITY_DN59421_c0_g1_i1:105-722(-)